MLNNKKEFSINWGGVDITLETGRIAKQADGAVLVKAQGTEVLVTACSARKVKDGQDFFPLMVDYTEKFYAAGKFLGGYLKREGRPSTAETLTSRLIDRPLRPLFPEGYMFDTVIQCTVLSYNKKADPQVLAALGAAASLAVSDIPFNGPLASCTVGKINGQLVLNPTIDQWEESEMELLVSASKNAILMVEGEANEVSEEEMIDAINFAHDNIKEFCSLIDKMVADCGKTKREFVSAAANEKMIEKTKELFTSDARAALSITDKLERQHATGAIIDKAKEAIKSDPAAFGLDEDCDAGKEGYKAVDELMYDMLRTDILKEGKRIAGRGLTEVREIETETDIFSTPHGSSLFTRGETQVMATATIGGSSGDQMVDRIVGLNYDKFYLHYNFPPYSVGEARGIRGVGRREHGHGNLAERALKKIVPSQEDFPYTIRVVCDVTESNGSSSMGSVCSGSMALMDAGVPMKRPVAGIAMGLVKEGADFKILTDILGDEDHLGDMDFKVAGTDQGITAIQMDIKITGITKEIFTQALSEAKDGRLHILGEMAKTISAPRAQFKDGVPRMETVKINKEKIGVVIGPGGKNIRALQEKFEVEIVCEEDGTIKAIGAVTENLKACVETIDLQVNGPKVGSEYDATVVTIKEYGAFVDIAEGVSGLVHVSEISDDRVKDVNEYVSEGDIVKIKVVEVDKLGRLKLSCKAVEPLKKK